MQELEPITEPAVRRLKELFTRDSARIFALHPPQNQWNYSDFLNQLLNDRYKREMRELSEIMEQVEGFPKYYSFLGFTSVINQRFAPKKAIVDIYIKL